LRSHFSIKNASALLCNNACRGAHSCVECLFSNSPRSRCSWLISAGWAGERRNEGKNLVGRAKCTVSQRQSAAASKIISLSFCAAAGPRDRTGCNTLVARSTEHRVTLGSWLARSASANSSFARLALLRKCYYKSRFKHIVRCAQTHRVHPSQKVDFTAYTN
jgi:hypothetical protein